MAVKQQIKKTLKGGVFILANKCQMFAKCQKQES